MGSLWGPRETNNSNLMINRTDSLVGGLLKGQTDFGALRKIDHISQMITLTVIL
jgi:hypothetical protein